MIEKLTQRAEDIANAEGAKQQSSWVETIPKSTVNGRKDILSLDESIEFTSEDEDQVDLSTNNAVQSLSGGNAVNVPPLAASNGTENIESSKNIVPRILNEPPKDQEDPNEEKLRVLKRKLDQIEYFVDEYVTPIYYSTASYDQTVSMMEHATKCQQELLLVTTGLNQIGYTGEIQRQNKILQVMEYHEQQLNARLVYLIKSNSVNKDVPVGTGPTILS